MQNADEAEINFVGDDIQGMRAAPSGQRSVERADSGFGGSSALEDSNDNLGDIDEPLPKRRRFSSDSSDSRDEGEPDSSGLFELIREELRRDNHTKSSILFQFLIGLRFVAEGPFQKGLAQE
ncbi:hypothetical protein QAD02_018442 [Eretmocerus hayati]|uniref:Uncharacterized protein n=1 Tax=Eretmocerus hayati TaxID=131215 RepID=A0ACC2PLJ4_9HYME|nr:hypothetical protein QAD02_018442 [Eretmocerus hayati]